MNYNEAIDYIHGTLKFGSKLGLETITKLLELMGNPHKKIEFVHVAGTNGKGSTTAYISNILISSGYRTGMFTSPYIQRFTERIQVNNIEIQADELTEIINFVKEKIDKMLEIGYAHPTEFEIITAVAFEYFHRQKCDVAVMEVGLGGRYDSTNVIESPLAAVITTISLDHTDRLGKTIAEIAYQKAGIIKPACTTVIYPQTAEAEEVFKKVCEEQRSFLQKADFSSLSLKEYSIEGQLFDYKGYNNLKIHLLGGHQLNNAALAVDTCEILREKGLNISENSIKAGLEKTKWPGRLEIINRNPLVLIDGAHNFEGGQSLSDALDKYFRDSQKIFIVGFLRDKEYGKIMELLAGKASLIITVTPQNERAIPSAELADILKQYSKNVKDGKTIEDGIKLALEKANKDSLICAFGSLYMIGEIRSFFDK